MKESFDKLNKYWNHDKYDKIVLTVIKAIILVFIGVFIKEFVTASTVSNIKITSFIGCVLLLDKTSFLNGSFEVEIATAIIKKSELNLTVFQDFTYSFQDSQSQKIKTSKQLSNEAYLTIPLSSSIRHTYQLVKQKAEKKLK